MPPLSTWMFTIAREVHACAKAHGWWDGVELTPDVVASKLALIHSEISEALEAIRNGYPQDKHCPEFGNFEIELADAMIRIMDLTEAMGLNIERALLAKHEFNKSRPYKHGGKVI